MAPWHFQEKESGTFNSPSNPVAGPPGCPVFFPARAVFKNTLFSCLKCNSWDSTLKFKAQSCLNTSVSERERRVCPRVAGARPLTATGTFRHRAGAPPRVLCDGRLKAETPLTCVWRPSSALEATGGTKSEPRVPHGVGGRASDYTPSRLSPIFPVGSLGASQASGSLEPTGSQTVSQLRSAGSLRVGPGPERREKMPGQGL